MISRIIVVTLCLVASAFANSEKPLVLYNFNEVSIEMYADDTYGVLLVNDHFGEGASPRYILAISKTRTVLDTKDFALFKSVIKQLPKKVTVYEYSSCSVPRSWGLKSDQLDKFYELFEELGLTLSVKPRVTCYCPSDGA